MSRILDEIARLDGEVARGEVTAAEAAKRIEPARIGPALFQADGAASVAARLVPAGPGIARGLLATSIPSASALVAQGLSVILAIDETEAEDVALMQRLAGIVALGSGLTGHAAIVSRALGLPCVLASARAHLDGGALVVREANVRVEAGAFVGLCGATGGVYLEPFAHGGPLDSLAMVRRWLDTAGAPQVEASVVSESERSMADAMGLSSRTRPQELPSDPARLSRVAPPWPRADESDEGANAPVPVVRAVAARLERARQRA